METLKYMIWFFVKLAFAFFFFAFVWWLVSLLFPNLSFRTLVPMFKNEVSVSTSTPEDLLPSPRKYQGLFGKRTAAEPKVFVAPPAFDGYNLSQGGNGKGYTYTTYTYLTYGTSTVVRGGQNSAQLVSSSAGTKTAPTNALPALAPNALLPNRTLYVRNLSIYEGGHIYMGLSFIGEARNSMFKEGKFPIVMVDNQGKVIGVSAAIAQTDWTVPGWVRFQTKIEYPLPRNMACTMVFEEAQTVAERNARMPVRVPIATQCN